MNSLKQGRKVEKAISYIQFKGLTYYSMNILLYEAKLHEIADENDCDYSTCSPVLLISWLIQQILCSIEKYLQGLSAKYYGRYYALQRKVRGQDLEANISLDF